MKRRPIFREISGLRLLLSPARSGSATEIELVANTTPGDGYHYISVAGSMISYTSPTGAVTNKTGAFINELVPMFKLEPDSGKNFVSFKLSGSDGTQNHEIDTKVYLYNVFGRAEAQNQVLKYKKP